MSESNPLVERVDALLKRHQQQPSASPAEAAGLEPAAQPATTLEAGNDPAPSVPTEDDIPVLTEIVDQGTLAEGIEAAVLERVLEELDQSLQLRLNRTIAEVVDQTLDGMRVDLAERVRHLVREAVAAALAKQGIGPKRSP